MRALCTGHSRTPRRGGDALAVASPTLWAPWYCSEASVSLRYSSLFITSCKVRGLLTTGSGQRDAVGCPTGCTDHDDQALRLQAPQTVPAIALGTGQRRHQLRGPPRAHPTGPLLIGCKPPPHLPLEA